MPICDYSAFSSYIGFRASLCYSREPRSILDGSRSQVEKRKGAHALPTHLTLSLVSTEIVIHPDSRAGGQCKILVLSGGTPSGYLRVYRGLNAYMRLFSLFVLHYIRHARGHGRGQKCVVRDGRRGQGCPTANGLNALSERRGRQPMWLRATSGMPGGMGEVKNALSEMGGGDRAAQQQTVSMRCPREEGGSPCGSGLHQACQGAEERPKMRCPRWEEGTGLPNSKRSQCVVRDEREAAHVAQGYIRHAGGHGRGQKCVVRDGRRGEGCPKAKGSMRCPRFELGSTAWQAIMIPLH